MVSSWPALQLGEIVKIKGGKRLPKGSALQSEKSEHPYIRVRDMGTRYIPTDILEYVPNDVFPSIKNYIVEENDVIISIVGTIGLISIIDKPLHLASQTENCAKLSGLDSSDAHYLYYYLNSYVGQQKIKEATVGAVQAKLPLYGLNSLSVIWPERHIREQIVHNLIALDDKIELNRKTNQTLEKMAQALFKSWFVDFDPVFDNALASGIAVNDFPEALQTKAEQRQQVQQQIANGELNTKPLPEDISQLFPSEFEQTDELSIGINGWIPKGWKSGSLSSIAKFTSERIDGVDLTLENYISTDNMLSNKGGVENASKLPTLKTTPAFKIGDILVSNIRPYFKKIWFASHSGGRSNDVLGFEALNTGSKEYLLNLLYQDAFFDFMMTTAKGSKMPRGDKKAIMDWGLSIPPSGLQEYFSKFVRNYYQVIPVRNKEIGSLTNLRNTLLPKLISGEIDLSNNHKEI